MIIVKLLDMFYCLIVLMLLKTGSLRRAILIQSGLACLKRLKLKTRWTVYVDQWVLVSILYVYLLLLFS